MRPRCLRCGEGKAVSEVQPICVDCLWRIRGPSLRAVPDDDRIVVAERFDDGGRLLIPARDYLTGRWRRHV